MSPLPRLSSHGFEENLSAMDKAALARAIRDRAFLTGRFTLRSGAVSTVYWDKYRFESDPELLRAIAQQMRSLLPTGKHRLAGLELGGIPLAVALSLEIGVPALFVRKAAKAYGTANLVEGGFNRGDRAVVIEDVVTSGGQVLSSVQQLRELGLSVEHVVCVIDREEGGAENIADIGCRLAPLFTMTELERLALGGGTAADRPPGVRISAPENDWPSDVGQEISAGLSCDSIGHPGHGDHHIQ